MSDAGITLAVLGGPGAGKATTIGNLMYMCGGIDMLTLERLEKGHNSKYAKAFREIKAKNELLYFYTPGNKVTITVLEKISSADCLLLVVTPHQIEMQLEGIGDQLASMEKNCARKRIVIVVNKMDEVNWSETAFTDSVQATNAVLQGLGIPKEQTIFVPASGLYSDNLIELSSNLGWYSNSTDEDQQAAGNSVPVVVALDRIIS